MCLSGFMAFYSAFHLKAHLTSRWCYRRNQRLAKVMTKSIGCCWRFVSLAESGGLTNWQSDNTIHKATLLTWPQTLRQVDIKMSSCYLRSENYTTENTTGDKRRHKLTHTVNSLSRTHTMTTLTAMQEYCNHLFLLSLSMKCVLLFCFSIKKKGKILFKTNSWKRFSSTCMHSIASGD